MASYVETDVGDAEGSVGKLGGYPMKSDPGDEMDSGIFIRHLMDQDATKRVEILAALRKSAKKNQGRFPLRNLPSFFEGMHRVLGDIAWEVRYEGSLLLAEVIRDLRADEVDAYVAVVLPRIVANLGHESIVVRRGTLHLLGIYMRLTNNLQHFMRTFVQYGLESDDYEIRKGCVTCLHLLFTEEFAHENLFILVESLARLLDHGDMNLFYYVFLAMRMFHRLVGSFAFESYLQRVEDGAMKMYYSILTQSNNNSHDSSEGMRELLHHPAGSLLALRKARRSPFDFGILETGIVESIQSEDWRARVEGVEHVKIIVRDTQDLDPLIPHMEDFLSLLSKLLDDACFKVVATTLDVYDMLIQKFKGRLKPFVRTLVSSLCKRLGDRRIVVRQHDVKVVHKLMHVVAPKLILNLLLDCKRHRNPRLREEIVNRVTGAVLTFPSYDFDFGVLCDAVAPALIDSKRRVRLAALECFAVLAQAIGPIRVAPLLTVVDLLETDTESEGLLSAVQTRLSRRVLPRCTTDGDVVYALNVPSSPGLHGSPTYASGADVDWVLTASGSLGSTTPPSRNTFNSVVTSPESKTFRDLHEDSRPSTMLKGASSYKSNGFEVQGQNDITEMYPEWHMNNNTQEMQHTEETGAPGAYSQACQQHPLDNMSDTRNVPILPSKYVKGGSSKRSSFSSVQPKHGELQDLGNRALLATAGAKQNDGFSIPWKPTMARASSGGSGAKPRPHTLSKIRLPSPVRNPPDTLSTKSFSSEESLGKVKESYMQDFIDPDQESPKRDEISGGMWNEEVLNTEESETLIIVDEYTESIRDSDTFDSEQLFDEKPVSEPFPLAERTEPRGPTPEQNTSVILEAASPVVIGDVNLQLAYVVDNAAEGHVSPQEDYDIESEKKGPSPPAMLDETENDSAPTTSSEELETTSAGEDQPFPLTAKEQVTPIGNHQGLTEPDKSVTSEPAADDAKEDTDKLLTVIENTLNVQEVNPSDIIPLLSVSVMQSAHSVKPKGAGSIPKTPVSPKAASPKMSSKKLSKKGDSLGSPSSMRKRMVTASNLNLFEDAPDRHTPFTNPDEALKMVLKLMAEESWISKVEGMQGVKRLANFHPLVLQKELHAVTLALCGEVRNLRSSVSRCAILTLGELFEVLRKTMETELEIVTQCLLHKSGENVGFIREDIEKTLTRIINTVNTYKAAVALINGGGSHRNAAVRKVAAQFLSQVVEKLGANRCFVGPRDFVERLLPLAANFLMDGAPVTRYYGRRIFFVLMLHPDFDRATQKYVQPSTLRNISTIVAGIKKKGPGEIPKEGSSAKSNRSDGRARILNRTM